MFIFSLNGPDNVGKTTHIRLLRACRPEIPDLGGIHLYGHGWPEPPSTQSSQWWFSDARSDELVRTVSNAFRARSQAIQTSFGCVALDRGGRQFEAVLVASVMIKERISAEKAREFVHNIAGDLSNSEPRENVRVMLTHGSDCQGSVDLSLAREAYVSNTYRQYQLLLQDLLNEQTEAGHYDVVINCDGQSIFEIQNKLRAALSSATSAIPPLLSSVRTVFAFGGLSESGKSTAAEYLSWRHGVTRLKISYLLEVAAARNQLTDIYELPEEQLAELLALELDRFARRQYYSPVLSIESLHRMKMTEHLKKFLGGKLVIVFCDTRRDRRLARAQDSLESVDEKDAVKVSRGAQEIKTIADVILDNDNTLLHYYRQLDRISNQLKAFALQPTVNSLDDLGLPPVFRAAAATLLTSLHTSLGAGLVLFAIIGSRGRRQEVNEFSDLDILVVVECATTPQIQEALAHATSQIKIGLTVVTVEEMDRSEVDSKIFHALRLFACGGLAAQFVRAGYTLPMISAREDLADSLAYLPSVIQRLRRELLKVEADAREIGKACFLLAKIVLRAQGVEVEGRHTAFESLKSCYPGSATRDLDLIATGRSGEQRWPTRSELLAAATNFLHWIESFSVDNATMPRIKSIDQREL